MEVVKTTTKHDKYFAYKDSGVEWLGEIPKDWTPKKVFHYFRAEKGRNAAILTREFCGTIEGKFPVYSGQTENNGVMALINEYEFDYSKEGCLFTTTVGAKAMSVSFIKDKFSLSQNCMIIIRRNKKVLNKFFFYQFQAIFQFYRKLIPDHMQASFRMEDLYQYHFILPSFPEQTAIATFLDDKTTKIDTAIAQKEQMIALLKERKQIVIQNAVTGKWSMVNGQWAETPKEKMKDSGVEWIGEIPEGWEVKKLKYILKIKNGQEYKHVAANKGYPVIGSGGPFSFASEYLYDGEALLLGRKGTIDKPLYVNEKFWTVDTMFYAIVNTSYSTKYIYYLSQTIPFKFYSTSTALPSMTQDVLNNHKVAIPSLEEQLEVTEYLDFELDKYENAISLQQTQIEKLKEYKATLIDSAVTGKIKVTDE